VIKRDESAMKILSVNYRNPHLETMTECIERAIVGMGHELKPYDYRSWTIPGRIRDRVPFLQNLNLRSLNNALASTALKFNPDLLLVTGGYTISGGTVEKIRKKVLECKTVKWIADFPLRYLFVAGVCVPGWVGPPFWAFDPTAS
jgi:hypothetical protein